MKHLTRIALFSAALIGGLAVATAHAGGGCHRHHGLDSEARINRLATHLELSHEQRDRVRAIVDKARPDLRRVSDGLRDNHQAMRALMQQGKPDEKEIRRLADARGKLVAEMTVLRARMKSEIHAVLTPDQRDKLQQHIEKRRRSSAGTSPMESRPHTAGLES